LNGIEATSLAESLGNADLAILEAPHEHDAFPIETDQLSDLIAGWLSRRRELHATGSAR